MPKTPSQKLRGYLLSAVAVALGLIVLGFVALWLASGLHDQTAATVVREFAAVLLALGVLELAHRFVLERSLVREILTLLRLEQRLVDLGLEDFSGAPADWAEFLGEGRSFAIMPADPLPWLQTEWARALSRARQGKVSISLYLPAWTGAGLPAIAARLNADPAQLAAETESVVRGVSDSWAHSTDLTKGSELSIYLYEDIVAYGLALSDRRSILLLPECRGHRPGGVMMTAAFRQARDDLIPKWALSQIQQLHKHLNYKGTAP